jgi:transcriptional regulator with XRE-family HTH domain
MANLGELVRDARTNSGLSQRSLALRAGTTQAAISRIERGLEEPSFERFTAIMQSMGWQPSVELMPVAGHREEPRRLLEEARYGDASTRLTTAVNGSRFALELRRAVERAN